MVENLTLTKISSNSYGDLYNVYYRLDNTKNKIKIFLNHSITPFGLDVMYNKKIIKWSIDEITIENILRLENSILEYTRERLGIEDPIIKSKIHRKEGYNSLLETQINHKSSSNNIISHEEGEIYTIFDIHRGFKSNVELELGNITIKDDKISYILYIKKLTNCVF